MNVESAIIIEEFVSFGPESRLTGVFSRAGEAGQRPTLLLLNAGTFPRSGPFRLYVDLARTLARLGISSMRIDAPGVGEAPRLSECSEVEAVRSAMDALQQQHGCRRFVVGGVCSAADVAWRVMQADPRVTGALLLDGVSFRGPWFWLGRMRDFLRRPPGRWWAAIVRLLSSNRPQSAVPAPSDFRDWPTRDEARRQLQAFTERGARLLFLYTAGAAVPLLHPRQFPWSFGRAVKAPHVELHVWPDCDHLYYLAQHRQKLIAIVADWLKRDD